MKTLQTELDTKVDELLANRDAITDARDHLDYLIEQGASLKHEILDMDWPEKTLKYDDVTISRVETKDVKITDPKLVITWLKRNKIKVEDFMRLDTVKVRPLLKSAIFTQNKSIQGTEHETKVGLRVSEV